MAEGLAKEGLQVQPRVGKLGGAGLSQPESCVSLELPTVKGATSAQDGEKRVPCSHLWGAEQMPARWEGCQKDLGCYLACAPSLSHSPISYKSPSLLHT